MAFTEKTTVRKINKIPFKGKVYNLKVEEDESYVANNITVHNCRSRIVFHPRSLGNVTEPEQKAVKLWHASGVGASEQARLLGRSKRTVYRIWEKLRLV